MSQYPKRFLVMPDGCAASCEPKHADTIEEAHDKARDLCIATGGNYMIFELMGSISRDPVTTTFRRMKNEL